MILNDTPTKGQRMFRWFIFGILFLLLLSACNGKEKSDQKTEVGQDFPTITPAIRLTRVVPTLTVTENPATTATNTAPTRTPMRLMTNTPDDDAPVLPTFGPSPTNTKTPPTKTPTPSPIPVPQIRVFTVNPNPVSENGTVTFSWDIQGATTGEIRWTPPGMNISETLFTVNEAIGSTELYLDYVSFPSQQITFELVVNFEDGQRRSESANLSVTCNFSFFVVDLIGQGMFCPLHEPLNQQAAFQTFENGLMLWDDYDRLIYSLYDDGTCHIYADEWTGQEIIFGETPPAGLYQPLRGLGYLWVNRAHIRNRLGWATMELELGYTTVFQQVNARDIYGAFLGVNYFTLPDGSAIRVNSPSLPCEWGYAN